MCHDLLHVFFLFFISFGQSGEVYRWRVCYQRGLPRLLYKTLWGFNVSHKVNMGIEFCNDCLSYAVQCFTNVHLGHNVCNGSEFGTYFLSCVF